MPALTVESQRTAVQGFLSRMEIAPALVHCGLARGWKMHYRHDHPFLFRLIFIVQAAPTTLEGIVLMESRRGAERPATDSCLVILLFRRSTRLKGMSTFFGASATPTRFQRGTALSAPRKHPPWRYKPTPRGEGLLIRLPTREEQRVTTLHHLPDRSYVTFPSRLTVAQAISICVAGARRLQRRVHVHVFEA